MRNSGRALLECLDEPARSIALRSYDEQAAREVSIAERMRPSPAPETAKPKRKRGPNKTEQRYAEILKRKLQAGLIRSYAFEKVTLKLADDTRYTVDFLVWHNDGSLEAIEVKGKHIWDDSKVKWKVAAEAFPWIKTWRMIQWDNETGWREILSREGER